MNYSKNMRSQCLIAVLAAASAILSCTKQNSTGIDNICAPRDYDSVAVPTSNLLLYADLSAYDASAIKTRTSSAANEDEYTPLSALLDFENAIRYTSPDGRGRRIIPFLGNSSPDLVIRTDEESQPGDLMPADSLMILRKFLLECENDACVLTMISDIQEHRLRPSSTPDCLADFTGYLMYSTLKGEIMSLLRCSEGQLSPAGFLDTGSETSAESTHLQGVATQGQPQTRALGGMLDASYCNDSYKVAGTTNLRIDNSKDEKTDWIKRFEATINKDVPIIYEGGNAVDKNTMVTVSLASAVPDMGSAEGSGTYLSGTTVSLKAVPKVSPAPIFFHYWTGDLRQYGAQAVIKLKGDVTGIAHFLYADDDPRRPCVDTTAQRANMLVDMSIAPSGGWNYKGGTYGKNIRSDEDGNGKDHTGIDFSAAPGTPVYVQYDGEIEDVDENCPKGLIGSKYHGGYGNTIKIKSKINGKDVIIMYAHLQYGNAIASNPLTGRKYKTGDKVMAGDLIGFTGATGNAWNDDDVPCKHVHCEIWENGTRIDPIKYMNGNLKSDYTGLTGTKCDDLQTKL